MAITSQVRGGGVFGELFVQDWQAAKLLKPSAIKPVLATFEQAIIVRTLGRLSARDQQAPAREHRLALRITRRPALTARARRLTRTAQGFVTTTRGRSSYGP